ncbi:MAG: metallophosphoesterase [Clostridiales bacterium]|nr:metallophosphoesterase [Clostridiales bacterium]
MLKYEPAVFVVGDDYQIMVIVEKPSLMWVEINGKCYYDETNGILRSTKEIHRITIPACVLNAAQKYTVCEREIIERKAYHTESEEEKQYGFSFKPVKNGRIRAFHISDTHSLCTQPINAANSFGEMDFLILNGDMLDHCENAKDFNIIYDICAQITHGEIPIVFSRGNHDMRGANTEIFPEYTPNCNGRTYYTFRLGSLWGMVLDCGEDKADSHAEYGNTVCCHQFRLMQSEFIKNVIKNAKSEYLADGVKYRIVISHIAFTHNWGGEFEIEIEIYSEWARLLGKNIKPHIMIQGHSHRISVNQVNSEFDSYGVQPCPVVIASHLSKDYYAGCGFTFDGNIIDINAVSDKGKMIMHEQININN